MKRVIGMLLASAMLTMALPTLASCQKTPTYAYKEDENGIILADGVNARMLGRSYCGLFSRLDEEDRDGDGKKLVKYEDVYHFNWPASGFELSFNGTGIKAQILCDAGNEAENPVTLYSLIDGDDEPDDTKLIELNAVDGWVTLCEGLPNGTHTVRVIRRDYMGTNGDRDTALRAFDVLGGDTMNEAPAPRTHKIEAFGDSITCGEELALKDFDANGKRVSYADVWRTYEAYVARRFDAELSVVSMSGNGLLCSLLGSLVGNVPDHFSHTDVFHTGKRDDWDFANYPADLVLINLGTNDGAGVPQPHSYEDYEQAYVDFCVKIKTAYPDCRIVALLGMMSGSGKLWQPIENAAKRINEQYGDGTMFTLWLELPGISDSPVEGGVHPSAEAQTLTGEYVCKLIEENLGWERKK